MNKEAKNDIKKKKKTDPEKKARIRYYFKLSAALAVVLIAVAAAMFLYLRHEAMGYRAEFVAQLTEGMEDAKDTCYNTLKDCGAQQEVLDNIETQYENAMKESDVLQQYYLVDGLMDYSLTSLYNVANLQHQDSALNGTQWKDFDDEIETIIDAQANLQTIKEQISSIDLDNYY